MSMMGSFILNMCGKSGNSFIADYYMQALDSKRSAVQCYVVPETNLLSIKQICKAIGALNPGLAIIIVVHISIVLCTESKSE